MKNQALFSSKDKSKKLKCRLLQFLFGALRVKMLTQRCLHGSFIVVFCVLSQREFALTRQKYNIRIK